MIPNMEANEDGTKTARQIVFLTAVFSTALGSLYAVGLAGKLIVDGTVHSVSARPIQVVSAIIAILLDLTLLIMFVALRRQALPGKAVLADLGAVFMALVCGTSSMSWFVQLAVLPKLAQTGDSTLLGLVDMHNSSSITYAIEHLGWGIFYGLATIFMASAIGAGRFESQIRWLFIAGGILSILHIIGIVTMNSTISDLGYLAWGVLLPVTTTILAIRFRREEKRRSIWI